MRARFWGKSVLPDSLPRQGSVSVFNRLGAVSEIRYRAFLTYRTSIWGRIYDVIQLFLSLFFCGLYVYETYEPLSPLLQDLEIVVAFVFLFDYVVMFLLAEKKSEFLLSFSTIADITSFIPVLLELFFGVKSVPKLSFLRALRALRLLRLIRSLRVEELRKEIILLISVVIGLVFVSTGFVYHIEQEGNPDDVQVKTFLDATYLIIVTMSTVGYGDITPKTLGGRLTIVLFISIALLVVPYQSTRLLKLIRDSRAYLGFYNPPKGLNHVIVCGNKINNAGIVSEFLREFFHLDHDVGSNRDRAVVICSPEHPNSDVIRTIERARYVNRVRYIRATILSSKDLQRLRVSEAKAAFVLTDKFTVDRDAADSANVLRVRSLQMCAPDIETYVQIIRVKNKPHALAAGARVVVCIEELKSAVLAQSVRCPGFVTLTCNLIRSLSASDLIHSSGSWLDEYCVGATNEIYKVKIAQFFDGWSFTLLALYVYSRMRILPIAVEITDEDTGQSEIAINPGTHCRVQAGGSCFVIADSYESATRLVEHCRTDQMPAPLKRSFTDLVTNLATGWRVSTASKALKVDAEKEKAKFLAEDYAEFDEQVPIYRVGTNMDGDIFERFEEDQDEEAPRKVLNGQRSHETLRNRANPSQLSTVNSITARHLDDETTEEDECQLPNQIDMKSVHFEIDKEASDSEDSQSRTPSTDNKAEGDSEFGEIDDKNDSPGQPSKSIAETAEQFTASQMLHDHYAQEPVPDHTLALAKDIEHVSEHILVIGTTMGLVRFVSALRKKHFAPEKEYPIVLLHPKKPTLHEWSQLEVYDDIYFVQGSGTSWEDLMKGRILEAARVVILAEMQNLHREETYLVDASTVMMTVMINARMPTTSFVVSELVHSDNIKFLGPADYRAKNTDVLRTTHPVFAAGMTYASSLLDTLNAQTYFNNDLLRLMKRLLICEGGPTNMPTSYPYEISIPQSLCGRSFLSLFRILSRYGALVLALYRSPQQSMGQNLPFLYCMPLPETCLRPGDGAIILCSTSAIKEIKLKEGVHIV